MQVIENRKFIYNIENKFEINCNNFIIQEKNKLKLANNNLLNYKS